MKTDQSTTVDRGPFLTTDDEVAHITFDDPDRGHNVLDEAVVRRLAELVAGVRSLAEAGTVRALVVRSGKDAGFVAGADVNAIDSLESPDEGSQAARFGQEVYGEIEALPIPTVAAIHGVCLGGGLELALACTYRVASDSPKTRLGLPEVQLGILPGWGGTTRLPRLVGLQAALDLILTGKTISARSARRIGLLNEVFPADLFQARVDEFADGITRDRKMARPARPLMKRLLEDTAPGRRVLLTAAKRQVRRRTGGHYPAPMKILEVLGQSLGRSVSRALEIEAAAFGELVATPVSKNLIHVFQLREKARKGTGVAGPVEPVAVESMGILGAGVMGGGIAQLAAYNGIRVRVKDIRHDAVSGALRHARRLFDGAVERRKLTALQADQRMELISGGLGFDGFAQADLVVEAIVERMDVKRAVLAEVERIVRDDCVIASNTSSLSIDEMAAGMARPGRFAGMHFFNPVHRMPLVEVIRGSRTTDRTVAAVHALALRLGKVPVVVKDAPGFLVNRILGPYLNEAGFLVGEGASVETVDAAARHFGLPMGPLRLLDEVGIDVAGHAGAVLHAAFGDRLKPAPVLEALAGTDRLGRKGGRGFYLYEGDREKAVDPTVYADLAAAISPRKEIDERAIRRRLVLVMINEAARILDEGIVEGAGDVDLGMIMGTGFPPFRGGLLRYADSIHVRAVVEDLKEYEDALGPRFSPAPLLLRLAESGEGFYRAFGSG